MKRHVLLVCAALASCEDSQVFVSDSTVADASDASDGSGFDSDDASSFDDAANSLMDAQK